MPRAPRYFLPWHFEFLCRWRPMDDACEELTALSRHTPLMQSGREVDALLATIEVARERGGRSRRWALVAVGALVAVDGVRRAKREWRTASRVCAPLCVLRSLSSREQSAPASPFLRDHTTTRRGPARGARSARAAAAHRQLGAVPLHRVGALGRAVRRRRRGRAPPPRRADADRARRLGAAGARPDSRGRHGRVSRQLRLIYLGRRRP